MIVSLHNPVIPTQIFAQSRNTNAYFWHPISRVYFRSRILSPFSFKIPKFNNSIIAQTSLEISTLDL